MAKWVDFKTIKSQVSIEKVLERYGVLETLKRKKDSLVGPCPIHKGTNQTQFHVSLTKNNFNCFGDCHAGGNVIDLVVMMEGMDKESMEDVRKAALMMQEWFGIEEKRPTKVDSESEVVAEEEEEQRVREEPAKEKKEELVHPYHQEIGVGVNPPLKFTLKNLDPEHPYLTERGLTKETREYFGLGYCQKGIMAGRIAIPIHNEKGELVAYIGRWPGEPPEGEGKYRLPANFHKGLELFNYHRAKEVAREQGLIVVEGFFDCMKVWQAGFQNVVALMGSSLSDEQERLIVEAVGPNGKVALMFDEDDAGWAGREEALERLASRVYVKVIGLHEEGAQPDSLSEEEIRERVG